MKRKHNERIRADDLFSGLEIELGFRGTLGIPNFSVVGWRDRAAKDKRWHRIKGYRDWPVVIRLRPMGCKVVYANLSWGETR